MDTPEVTYSIEPLAYLKLIFHAAKYPHATVTGLLIGSYDKGKRVVKVQDAIPLLHHWTELSPMMEAGLQMAEIHVETKGQIFVGLYIANERLEDVSIPTTLGIVAGAVRKEFSQAIVLVVENEKIAGKSPAVLPYLPGPSVSWSAEPLPSRRITFTDPSMASSTLDQIRKKQHRLLGDFDEHLEDVRVDWLENTVITI